MKPFTVPVASVAEGAKLLDVLADYDLFQFNNRIKPDYCNAGGLNRWTADCDGEGTPGWESWYDEETNIDDPREFIQSEGGEPTTS